MTILLLSFSILLFKVAQFNVYFMGASVVFPALMAFYLGAWIDIFGRKRIMYLFCFASILDAGGTLLNAIFIDWPLLVLIPSTIWTSVVGKMLCLFNLYN